MLIAWANGKKRRNAPEYEDEIVSAIFGPLMCARTSDKVDVFKKIGLACGISALNGGFDNCHIEFWPNIASSGRVEPDLLVTMKSKEETVMLLLEAKWDAEQGEDQLRKQWDCALARYGHRNGQIWHIYLTKAAHSLEEMVDVNASGSHRERIVNLTWARLAHTLEGISDLAEWGKSVSRFLSRLGHSPFVGFRTILARHETDLSIPPNDRWHFKAGLMRIPESAKRCGDTWATQSWTFKEI